MARETVFPFKIEGGTKEQRYRLMHKIMNGVLDVLDDMDDIDWVRGVVVDYPEPVLTVRNLNG